MEKLQVEHQAQTVIYPMSQMLREPTDALRQDSAIHRDELADVCYRVAREP